MNQYNAYLVRTSKIINDQFCYEVLGAICVDKNFKNIISKEFNDIKKQFNISSFDWNKITASYLCAYSKLFDYCLGFEKMTFKLHKIQISIDSADKAYNQIAVENIINNMISDQWESYSSANIIIKNSDCFSRELCKGLRERGKIANLARKMDTPMLEICSIITALCNYNPHLVFNSPLKQELHNKYAKLF